MSSSPWPAPVLRQTATVAGSPYPITRRRRSGPGCPTTRSPTSTAPSRSTPASAIIVVTGYTVTYDALPHIATGTATGVLGEDLAADLDLSATDHTAVGSLESTRGRSPIRPATMLADAGTVATEITRRRSRSPPTTGPRRTARRSPSPGPSSATSGLLGTDTVTSVTLTSAGLPRRPRRWPAAPTRSPVGRAVGTGLGQLHDHLCRRRPDGRPGAAHDHRQRPDQDVRPDGDVRRDRVQHERPARHATPSRSVSLASPGAPATATVAGSPYPITASAAVGTGLGNYTISYVDGHASPSTRRRGHRRDRLLRHLRRPAPYRDRDRHRRPRRGPLGRPRPVGHDPHRGRQPRSTRGRSATRPATMLADAGTVGDEITPAPLTITADDRTKTYGQTVTFAGTEFSDERPARDRHRHERHPGERRRRRRPRRSPAAPTRSPAAARRHGPVELHDQPTSPAASPSTRRR